jgi:hypothetical protein
MDGTNERRDRGSASVLMAAALVVVALATLIVARVVVAAADLAAAQRAADAAALAGVTGGPGAAADLARDNDAELVAFARGPGRAGGTVRVTVTVRRGARTAEATAEGDPRARRGPPIAVRGTLTPTRVLYADSLCPMATSVRRPTTPRTPTRTTTMA